MCGRIAIGDMSWEDFDAWLAIRPADRPIPARYNVPPTREVPIVHRDGDALQGAFARWGLVPHWHRGALSEMRFSTFNARAEDAARKPAFRDAWRRGRCLVLARGYFEWKRDGDIKQPFFMHPAGNAPGFVMAGLMTRVALADFEGGTCAVLTEPAEGDVAAIHHRMPVILAPEAVAGWLGGADLAEVARLAPTARAHHPVAARVGTVRNDEAGLIAPAE